MNKKLILAVTALLCLTPSALRAQEEVDSLAIDVQNEQAFTFTEAQLGEDDDVTQNVTVISSNRNVYANEVGYRFSPARFKYRAYGSKYNDIHINGNPVNDVERGEFRYSFCPSKTTHSRWLAWAVPTTTTSDPQASPQDSAHRSQEPTATTTHA